MKVITMQRLTMDGEPIEYNPSDENGEDYTDWFCVIETKEEELVYDKFIDTTKLEFLHAYTTLWNDMVKHAGIPQGLAWGDDDVYGYIRPDETCPMLTEKYIDGDGDVWVRVE